MYASVLQFYCLLYLSPIMLHYEFYSKFVCLTHQYCDLLITDFITLLINQNKTYNSHVDVPQSLECECAVFQSIYFDDLKVSSRSRSPKVGQSAEIFYFIFLRYNDQFKISISHSITPIIYFYYVLCLEEQGVTPGV